jgi:hypothetical protein
MVFKIANARMNGAGKRACCRAKLIGGSKGKPSLGVMIDLREPNDLLSAIDPQPF